MKRSLVFLATACALCVAWVLCKGMQADTRTVEIEGEAIPYICQNEKVYVYLKDLLDSGFFVDAAESRTLETRSGMVSEIVLWQEDIYPKEDKKIGNIPHMQDGWKYETYINGLQIGTYACQGELLVDAEELIGQPVSFKEDASMIEKTVSYDQNGNGEVLPENLEQITKTNRNSVHGNPEAPNRFSFENCSQYLMRAEKNTAHKLGIDVLQKGDILKTKKGSFPLEEVKAGECAGVSVLTIQEEYTELSAILKELGISYSFNNGKLELGGKGNGKTINQKSTDAMGTIPQYPYRMFTMTLELSSGEKLDCLYDGEKLFAANNDLEQTDVWKECGYTYENGNWTPLK